MDIVIDTSALMAVIVGEPEKEPIVALTSGHTLIGPGSIPWEVGNAFSAMLKRSRLSLPEAKRGFQLFQDVPIRYITPDFANVLALADQHGMYAYDAYFLDCALRHGAPLLTLDKKLSQVALQLGISVLEL